MSKAVRFDRYGGVDVLRVVEVEDRAPESVRCACASSRRASTPARSASARGPCTSGFRDLPLREGQRLRGRHRRGRREGRRRPGRRRGHRLLG
ncbi:MAG: hypothetical protein WDM88_07375 [Galbitalea sp.]